MFQHTGLYDEISELLEKHHSDPWSSAPPWAIALRNKVDRLEELIMLDFTDITKKVAAQKTVIDGTAVAVAGIRAQLAALATQPQPPTQADIQAVLDGLDANTNEIIAAVPEGTGHPPVTADAVAAAAANATATVAAPAAA